jgi:hypothetical protein
MWPVVGLTGDGRSSAAGRATYTSTPPRSSRWAAERPMCQTRPPRLRRPLGCGPLPNRAWCRNSGRNEIECDSRCRRRVRRPSAGHRAAPVLSDTSRRNGRRCRCGAGTPCGRSSRSRDWACFAQPSRNLKAAQRYSQLATPHAHAAVSLYRPRQPLTMGPTIRIPFAPAASPLRTNTTFLKPHLAALRASKARPILESNGPGNWSFERHSSVTGEAVAGGPTARYRVFISSDLEFSRWQHRHILHQSCHRELRWLAPSGRR